MKAVFLDKDGTLIEDVPYNVNPAKIRLMPGAAAGLRLLHQAGYKLIVISNQAGVALGLLTENELLPVKEKLHRLFIGAGAEMAGFYYCPHHPEGRESRYAITCECRKPAPGLILRAAREHGIDLAKSWFVGDILHDVEAGHRAGCRSVLIDNGHETVWDLTAERVPEVAVLDLCAAARQMIAADRQLLSNLPTVPQQARRRGEWRDAESWPT